VHLSVTAGSPLAEVFLIDDQFALVARSLGDLDCEAPPGVYKVKAKLGDATVEQLVLLEGNQKLDVSRDLTIGSAVPIATPSLVAGSPMAERQVTAPQLGPLSVEGAQLFLMARSEAAADDPPAVPSTISVLDRARTTLGFLELGAGSPAGPPSMTIDVDAGPYLLRRRDRFGDVAEHCVPAVSGWQTQVFTLESAASPAALGGTRVSVLMARESFDPADPHLRLIEEARTALADKRKVASEALGVLVEEIDNPMLGLFAAHLMLIARDSTLLESERRRSGRLGTSAVTAPVQFDQRRFDRIVDRLSEVLGPDNPDVVALGTQRTGQSLEALPPLTAAPMLWRSWVLLIEATNTVPMLVPVSLWQQTVHALPLRPFFLWAPTEERNDLTRSWVRGIASGLGPVTDSASNVGPDLGSRPSSLRPPQSEATDDENRRRLSERFLIPRAVVDRLAEGEEV